MEIILEEIIPWEKSHGYFSHANDKLTMKGFRHYILKKNVSFLDVYIVHLDADFYHPENCSDVSKDIATRKA
jgi:predicted glycosyltransferase involved in capsule biosynthesis